MALLASQELQAVREHVLSDDRSNHFNKDN